MKTDQLKKKITLLVIVCLCCKLGDQDAGGGVSVFRRLLDPTTMYASV